MPQINDSIFKSYDIRGLVGEDLNSEIVEKVGRALADYLDQDGPIVLGYDMRPSSIDYKEALIKGITEQGRDVIEIGLVSTDMVYFTVGSKGYAGGIMVTASHNPAQYNGLKICREKAIPVNLAGGLDVIRDKVLAEDFKESENIGKSEKIDVYDEWLEHALSFVDEQSFENLKVVVDAGNGMIGDVWPKLEEKLPNLITEQLYFKPDGTFPNHEANPIKTETLKDLSKKVVETESYLGIAFDGDGDRVGFVDENGDVVSGSMVFAVLAASQVSENDYVAHELRMSKSTLDFIENLGGKLEKTKVGNPEIKVAMRDKNAVLGGETTGHYMLAKNFNIDSGLIAGLIVVDYLRKNNLKFSEFVKKVSTYATQDEINFEVSDKNEAINKLSQEFSHQQQYDLDGLTINFESGAWFNVRPSNTEPLLRFNAEAKTEEELNEISSRVESILSQ